MSRGGLHGRIGGSPGWAATLVLCGAALLTACSTSPGADRHASAPPVSSSSTTTTGSVPATVAPSPGTTTPAALSPPAVPASGAYLGAWLHPASGGSGQSSFAVEQQTVPIVRSSIGRALGFLHVYVPWNQPAPAASLDAIASDGSLPMVDWGCAPNGGQLATSRADDPLITNFARTLKAFGRPVFLRWCWEMNLVGAHPEVGGPSGFVSAWTHIRLLFQQAGATNVAFVWSPALTGVDPAPYYPGASEVDWIAVDGYNRSGTSTFTSLFSPFYAQWAPQGKPMMVAETGARPTDQGAYLQSIASGMPTLPAFKGLAYFDATGPQADWALGAQGLQAFGALARSPYFAA